MTEIVVPAEHDDHHARAVRQHVAVESCKRGTRRVAAASRVDDRHTQALRQRRHEVASVGRPPPFDEAVAERDHRRSCGRFCGAGVAAARGGARQNGKHDSGRNHPAGTVHYFTLRTMRQTITATTRATIPSVPQLPTSSSRAIEVSLNRSINTPSVAYSPSAWAMSMRHGLPTDYRPTAIFYCAECECRHQCEADAARPQLPGPGAPSGARNVESWIFGESLGSWELEFGSCPIAAPEASGGARRRSAPDRTASSARA